jgi:hypothetical protein
MPERSVVRGKERHWWTSWRSMLWAQRVEVSRRITSEQSHLGLKILNRKTPRIKFNRY